MCLFLPSSIDRNLLLSPCRISFADASVTQIIQTVQVYANAPSCARCSHAYYDRCNSINCLRRWRAIRCLLWSWDQWPHLQLEKVRWKVCRRFPLKHLRSNMQTCFTCYGALNQALDRLTWNLIGWIAKTSADASGCSVQAHLPRCVTRLIWPIKRLHMDLLRRHS